LLWYLLLKKVNLNVLDDFDLFLLNLCNNNTAVKILINYSADISQAKLFYKAISILDDKRYITQIELVLGKGVVIDVCAMYPGHAKPGSRAYNSDIKHIYNKGTALH
jgi:hypothetical protein